MNKTNIKYTESGLIFLDKIKLVDFFKEEPIRENPLYDFNEGLIQGTYEDDYFRKFLKVFARCLDKQEAEEILYGALVMREVLKKTYKFNEADFLILTEENIESFIKDFSEITPDSKDYSRNFRTRIDKEEPLMELYNILLVGNMLVNGDSNKTSCMFARTGSYCTYEVYRRQAEANQLEQKFQSRLEKKSAEKN
jgi:hypothetical protein